MTKPMKPQDVIRTLRRRDPVDILKYIEYRFCRPGGCLEGVLVEHPNTTVQDLIKQTVTKRGGRLYGKKKNTTTKERWIKRQTQKEENQNRSSTGTGSQEKTENPESDGTGS